MRLMLLSDLHIGKRLNEFSLLDDQSYILDEILRIAEEQKPMLSLSQAIFTINQHRQPKLSRFLTALSRALQGL